LFLLFAASVFWTIACPLGRRRTVLENQGLSAIAFFEATAFLILLVLFVLLRKDHPTRFLATWITGWSLITIKAILELTRTPDEAPQLRLARILLLVIVSFLFLKAVIRLVPGTRRVPSSLMWPGSLTLIVAVFYLESRPVTGTPHITWFTSIILACTSLAAGWILWTSSRNAKGHGARLLAGLFMLAGLHGIDRPLWLQSPLFLLRIAFDHLLAVSLGIAMVVLVLERARARTDELNDKLRRLSLLTASSTQTLSVREVLDLVLVNVVASLGVSHGIIRLMEGDGNTAQLAVRAAVGFDESYLAKNKHIPASGTWGQRVLNEDFAVMKIADETDQQERDRMIATGVKEIVSLVLRGKDAPLGILAIGYGHDTKIQEDEIDYLKNIANLLGLTIQNVLLFEQVNTVQRQWAYTFDSIGDPIFVHDADGRIVRINQRMLHLTGRENKSQVGRYVNELFPLKNAAYQLCPYCEGIAGEGDDPDPWLPGYFLASNSVFADPVGRQMGTVHVLKDISDRKRAEEKYRTLVSSVQEGVFISTPQGHFLDFNDAFLRMAGYSTRDELMKIDIASLYANPADRERLKKLLSDHGSVADFEFDIRRKDGELRTVTESSNAIRDAAGNVTAYQGFLLDISERKRAEHEIRRRNRELLVLNSIANTLTESLDLSDSLHRTLRQLSELFSLDASSLYLLDANNEVLRRVATVGHRSELSRHFPPTKVQPELLQHIKAVHATFLSTNGLPLPEVFKDMQRQEQIASAHVVMLWSKDRVIGGLVVGSRSPRDFSPADVNLLIAVGSQISSAIERSLLYDQTRQAYDDLRRTQEQLLHSEKMAAVGQLISGVAHELNNPLTAILGYSQLLTSSAQIGPQGLEYSEKLYKQAQRTHRIVQNLLSFARQHKPERIPVRLNQVLDDTLALRDYDLRMSNIKLHLDLAEDLPLAAADPHQLQQVFLNLVNNAVDAILEASPQGELWVRTAKQADKFVIEFVDSGPGVKDPSKVFDPFYTTKPVGKGTGLGLSICYGIITEHGGQIRVSNLPPRGACFTIELPCLAIAATSDLSGSELVAPAVGTTSK
jgi:two-component system NtrC family sensor kinase